MLCIVLQKTGSKGHESLFNIYVHIGIYRNIYENYHNDLPWHKSQGEA